MNGQEFHKQLYELTQPCSMSVQSSRQVKRLGLASSLVLVRLEKAREDNSRWREREGRFVDSSFVQLGDLESKECIFL